MCRLLDIDIAHNQKTPFTRINLKTLEIGHYAVEKDPSCPDCGTGEKEEKKEEKAKNPSPTKLTSKNLGMLPEIEIISIQQIEDEKSIVIDVRHPVEAETSPIEHPLLQQRPRNIPLPELSSHLDDVPKDRRIVLLCPKNIRSVHGAQYLISQGYENVCVLDRFSF